MTKIKPMDPARRKRLEAAGFHFGDYAEFVGMTPEEKELTEVKLAMVRLLASKRKSGKLTQAELARIMGFSQPRVAKIESGDSQVGLDATFKALFAAGATRLDIADAISGKSS